MSVTLLDPFTQCSFYHFLQYTINFVNCKADYGASVLAQLWRGGGPETPLLSKEGLGEVIFISKYRSPKFGSLFSKESAMKPLLSAL